MTIRDILESWGKLVGVPVLIIASLNLMLAFCSYRFLVRDQPPHLLFTNGDSQPRFLRLYWTNDSKSVAWHGKARLFNLDEANKRNGQFGEADLEGASAKVIPGYGGQAGFSTQADIPARFLARVRYVDDKQNSFEQAFLLSLQRIKENASFSVTEETLPSGTSCD